MSSETWHSISIALLLSGMFFLALTVIFSVKFQLFQLIKTELNRRREEKNSDGRDYFELVEGFKKESNNIEKIGSVIKETKKIPVDRTVPIGALPQNVSKSETVPIRRNPFAVQENEEAPATDGTVVVSRSEKTAAEQDNATVVVKRSALNEEEFVMLESIVITHGDISKYPESAIKKFLEE